MSPNIYRSNKSQRSELANSIGETQANADNSEVKITTTSQSVEEHSFREDACAALQVFKSRLAVNKTLCMVTAFIAYSIVSVMYFGLPILSHLTKDYIGSGPDPTIFVWCLYWWPYAIVHGLDPFITRAIWAPQGTNLAWATAIPGLSFLAAPMTFTLGPVASYNILMLLSPALAALTTYVLVYHLTREFWPSLIGGYLFGFSSYEISELTAHLHLTFTFAIPLCTYLAILFFEDKIKPIVFALLMGVILSFQFSISTEVFATITVFGFIVLALAVVIFPSVRERIFTKGGMILGAYALTALLVSPYLYHLVVFGEPSNIIPTLTNRLVKYSSDLLNIVFPTPMTLIGSKQFRSISTTFSAGIPEEGAYIGLPLLLIVYIYASRLWHSRAGKLLTISLGLILLASLGPVLVIAGNNTIKLPWHVLIHIPLINQAFPARFMVYASLVISMMAATFLSGLRMNGVVKYGLISLAIIFLVPNLAQGYWASAVSTPAFFSQGLYKEYIDKGENVLVIPFGFNGQSMVWQAETGMYFRMAGGFVGLPPSRYSHLPIVQTFYDGKLFPDSTEQLKEFLGSQDVQAIIVVDPEPKAFSQLFGSLGIEPESIGGVTLYQVPQQTLKAYGDATRTTASQDGDLAQLSILQRPAGNSPKAEGSETESNPQGLEDGGMD